MQTCNKGQSTVGVTDIDVSVGGADLLMFNNRPADPAAEELCNFCKFPHVAPPNTTPLVKPMDQNVIQNIKLGYRKLLLTKIVNDPVHNENLEKTLKNVNLKDVVLRLANCWAAVSTLLFNKSWKNSLPNFIDSEVEENVQTEEEIQLALLINQLRNTNPMSNTEALQWAAEADDSLVRNEILTHDEIYQDGNSRR
ncbi:hypothetical protein AVEN_114454-1 [Araneus ventricosus]|uniref:DDE-1 domain-containing protein n=1 Tax=Araneus ventricosus TaxID=182803 RepID=A0A4Y2U3W3_ARAVE|nr:hypothetical protein AVEN_114454-1 [Araneus ventricosus]